VRSAATKLVGLLLLDESIPYGRVIGPGVAGGGEGKLASGGLGEIGNALLTQAAVGAVGFQATAIPSTHLRHFAAPSASVAHAVSMLPGLAHISLVDHFRT
jgi:hypothetical protein